MIEKGGVALSNRKPKLKPEGRKEYDKDLAPTRGPHFGQEAADSKSYCLAVSVLKTSLGAVGKIPSWEAAKELGGPWSYIAV